MPVPKVEFDVAPDKCQFATQTNGDRIVLTGMHFTQDDAAQMARFVNAGTTLTVIIKEKVI